MSLLYGNDFQSFSVGDDPPYGDLVRYTGVIDIKVVADSTGLFGQAKSISLPASNALAFPNPIYDGTGAFYQQSSVYQYIKLGNSTDVRGTLIAFGNAHNSIFNNILCGVRILTDGTLGIVADFSSAFTVNTKVSDYSLLCEKWYLVRTDVEFGSALGFITVLSCKVYVNGVSVVNIGTTTTTLAVADFTHLYFNNFTLFGAGANIRMGGLWIYDDIQSSTFYPNPTTPSARLNQGVIELIKKKTLPLGNTRIYEA